MPASLADSAIYRGLFGDEDTARLFSDTAQLRAMLLVEGALARVQGALGVIPAEAGAFLHRAASEVQIDPAALRDQTAQDGVPVPALIAAFRKASGAPDHARYAHWGATSQDIMDTGLALRLKRVLELWEDRLRALLAALAALAEAHADLPMAARTYGQIATPTSFGALVASWGRPLLRHLEGLEPLRRAVLRVSLGGAAGTLSAMGPMGPQVRAGLAEDLGLADPGHSWHAERDGLTLLAGWMAGLSGSLGKMGDDLIALSQSGIDEITIAGGGASSTMPQKQNPVAASALVALARQVIGLSATFQGAALHRGQRDGAAWFTEWLTLPQLCISTGCALDLGRDLAGRITPNPDAMARGMGGGPDGRLGLIHAEALTFALSDRMPRPVAQAAIKALCLEALSSGVPLIDLMGRDHPGTDWAAAVSGPGILGQAPAEARAFAKAVDQGASPP